MLKIKSKRKFNKSIYIIYIENYFIRHLNISAAQHTLRLSTSLYYIEIYYKQINFIIIGIIEY